MIWVVLSACTLGGALALGPYPITLFPTDSMHMLGQGDYLYRGLRPYVDYYSLHGPFSFRLMAAGMEVHGVSLKAILLAQILGAAIFAPLMFKIAASRLNVFWAVALSISVELLLISCTPLGRRSWREYSPAMWYNAICFAATGIAFLYVLLPSRSTRAASRWIDCVIAAFCLMATFLTKMSFFPPLAVVLFVGTVLWPRERSMRAQGLVAFALAAAMTAGVMWSVGGSLRGYLAFLGSVPPSVHPLALALRSIHHTRTIGLFAVGMLLAGWAAHDSGVLRETRREWFLCFLMFGAWLVTAATCKQDPESLPLLGVLPLCVTAATAMLANEARRSINIKLAAPALLIALILIAHDAKNSALSWVFSQMTIKTLEPPVERFPNAAYEARKLLTSERVDPDLFALMPKPWVESTFAALALLKDSAAKPGDVLFVAAIPNTVTMLTDFKYTHGDSPWSPFEVAADPRDVPLPVDDFLSDSQWILRDLVNPASWKHVTYFRGDYIKAHFEEVSRNSMWILYRRRLQPPNGNATGQAVAALQNE